MADKHSTLKLKVDLNCTNCYKKIQKILCEIQVEESMTRIFYDVKNNTVTISGPFDPQQLFQKLHCKAGKLIQGINIVPQAPLPPVASIRKVKPPSSCNAGKAIVPRNAIRDLSIVPSKAIVPRNAIRDLSTVPGKAISIRELKPQPPLPLAISLRNKRPQPPLELNLNLKFGGGCSSCGGSSR